MTKTYNDIHYISSLLPFEKIGVMMDPTCELHNIFNGFIMDLKAGKNRKDVEGFKNWLLTSHAKYRQTKPVNHEKELESQIKASKFLSVWASME
jgi:hypothetical protein